MRKFLTGVLVGVVVILLSGLLWIRLGFVSPRADMPENALERGIAMPALDASLDRHAPEVHNPLQPSHENLAAGMTIYQMNCASCHGDIQHPNGMFAESLYPRAPLFLKDAPDMPENQNFYVIQHGVRLSGMPAWSHVLNDQQIWQVTSFLSHINQLPPEITAKWKSASGAGATGASFPK